MKLKACDWQMLSVEAELWGLEGPETRHKHHLHGLDTAGSTPPFHCSPALTNPVFFPHLWKQPPNTHTLFFFLCFWGAMLVVPRSHSWLYTWKSRLIRFGGSYGVIRIKLRSLLILALELSSLPLPSPISLSLLEV